MLVRHASVLEDGTINGNVRHSLLLNPPTINIKFHNSVSSYGIGHAKHQNSIKKKSSYGVAGQDVYTHSDDSICVSDGHGKNGLYAAVAAMELRHTLSPTASQIILDSKSAERNIRKAVINNLSRADFEYSGSTFACMKFVTRGSRRWAITVNIGDSEALLVYSNRIVVCSVAHNWDNFTLYKRYANIVKHPRNVCYNRWNASKYRLLDKSGKYRPVMMYETTKDGVKVNEENMKWVSELYMRENKPKLKHGTQSIRTNCAPHENWGSCVMLYGRARGQNMATFGDNYERRHSRVPMDMVHVYIHEIPYNEAVIGIVQSDGVSNMRTLLDCGKKALSSADARSYISDIRHSRDDMSAAMYISKPKPIIKRSFHVQRGYTFSTDGTIFGGIQ